MKIWIKVIIVGIIIFFGGVFYVTAQVGNIAANSEGMLISFGGMLLIGVGVFAGIVRGIRRMMGE